VVSASFVSPTHGWALAGDGHIDQTTDGRRTWSSTGRLRSPQSTIRFIDDVGRIRVTRERGRADHARCGRTWTVTPTPFPNVFDLAIGRGTITVSSLQPPARPAFRIWTSPVAHLVWKQVCRGHAVGAGRWRASRSC